jgi:hypothetical protein
MNAVCSTWGYAVSADLAGYFPYPLLDNHAQNWDVFVVSHEMGHNFGGPHTHDMNPPIDGCAYGDCSVAPNGTIMSYCHGCPGGMTNIVLHFHERIINEEILPFLASLSCDLSAGMPTIYLQPADVHGCLDYATAFAVGAGGSPPLTFQWRKDGVDLPGATDETLTIDPVTESDAGYYDVVVTNGYGSAVSDPATLTIVECGPPGVGVAGCRHLAVTPQPPDFVPPVALQVTSPDFPCLSKYVDADGHLVDNPVFRTIEVWGTVYAGDLNVVPSTTYEVRTDFGSPSIPSLSEATVIVTPPWGDAVGEFTGTEWSPADGVVNFNDISAVVDRFKDLPSAPPLAWCDNYPESPDGVISFDDISQTVDAYRGLPCPFDGPDPCP